MERADRGAFTRVLYPILRGFWASHDPACSVSRYTTCFDRRCVSSAPAPDGCEAASAAEDTSKGNNSTRRAILTSSPAAERNSLEPTPAAASRCGSRPTRRTVVQSACRGFAAQPRRWKSSVATKPLLVRIQDHVYSHLGGVQSALQVPPQSPGILCLQSGDTISDGHFHRRGHGRQREAALEQHGPCAQTASPAAFRTLGHDSPAVFDARAATLQLARRALQGHSMPLSSLQQPSSSLSAATAEGEGGGEGEVSAASPRLSKAVPDVLVPNKAGIQQTQPRALQESRRKDSSQTAAAAAASSHADAVKLNKRLSYSTTCDKVSSIVESRLSEFSDINTATALQRLANLKAPRGLPALQSLRSKLQAEAPDFSPRALAMSLHALARLGVHAPAVFEAASASAARRLKDFEPLGLADLAWASCAAKRPHSELVEGVEGEVLQRIALRQPFCRHSLTNLLRALGDAGRGHSRAMAALLNEALPRLPELSGPGLASLVRSASAASPAPRQLLDSAADECLRRLDAEVRRLEREREAHEEGSRAAESSSKRSRSGRRHRKDRQGFEIGARELPVVAAGFARAQHSLRRPLLGRLVEASRRRLDEVTPQGLGILAWAFATLGQQQQQQEQHHEQHQESGGALLSGLVRSLVEAVDDRGALGALGCQGLANASWALVAAGDADEKLMVAIADAAMPNLDRFKSQELVMLLASQAKAGLPRPLLLDAATEEVRQRGYGSFCGHSLSSLAWALASSRHPEAPGALQELADAAAPRVPEFDQQGLALLAWACGATGVRAKEMLEAISCEVQGRRLEGFNAQDLANIAWGFAKVSHRDPELFSALAAAAEPLLASFIPQHLSNVAWAFARSRHDAPGLFAAMQGVAARRAADFAPQGLANVCWAFAAAGQPAEALLVAAEAEALSSRTLGAYGPPELAMLTQAASEAHPAPACFLEALAEEALGRLGEFNMHEVQIMALALEGWGGPRAEELRRAAACAAGRRE